MISALFSARRSETAMPTMLFAAICAIDRSTSVKAYHATALAPQVRLQGPAVVEEFGSTTVIFPQQELAVDPHGILVIRPGQGASGDVQ